MRRAASAAISGSGGRDRGDVLAREAHGARLGRPHRLHAGQRLRLRGVDLHHVRARDARADHVAPQHPGQLDVVGVLGAAGDLERPLEARIAALHHVELRVEIPGLEITLGRVDVHLDRIPVEVGLLFLILTVGVGGGAGVAGGCSMGMTTPLSVRASGPPASLSPCPSRPCPPHPRSGCRCRSGTGFRRGRLSLHPGSARGFP